MTLHDISHNFRNNQLRQIIKLFLKTFFRKQIIFIVLYPDNQQKCNYQRINK